MRTPIPNSPGLFDEESLRPSLLSCPDFLAPNEAAHLMQLCVEQIDWQQTEVRFGGRVVLTPRLTAWFGDVDYTYSGIRNRARPMPSMLRGLADQIEEWLAARGRPATFNSVLANYYRDGNDSIGMHSDDERELGRHPTIASISLGATSAFRFEHKTTADKIVLPLVGGSLLVMMDDTQENWRHGIRKEPGRPPRVNLTFRMTHAR